jgi:ABC-type Na+ efflux pump permease subunit
MLNGWTKVFRFTFHELTDNKGFRVSTVLIGVVLFLLVVGIFTMISLSQVEEDINPLTIKNIAVVDDTGYDYLDFGDTMEFQYDVASDMKWTVSFLSSSGTLASIQSEIADSTEDALLHIEKGEDGNLLCHVILPSQVKISGAEKDLLLELVSAFIDRTKSANINIEEQKLSILSVPVTTMYSVQGEPPESLGEILLKTITPILLVMLLYFMNLAYGQSAAKIISVEKTSKLMDTLLLSIKPYALIFGKILAMSAVGVMQFVIWFLAIIAGVFAGHYMGFLSNPYFRNPLFEAFTLLRNSGASNAFTFWSLLFCILSILLGFAFYMMIAGLIASRISKSEDLAQGMSAYQMLVVAGFLIAYIYGSSPLFEKLIDWIPFTSAYVLPGKIMIGELGLLYGIGMGVCLLLFTLVSAVLAARLYRNQVFYQK